jgi:hypothetical protein
MKKIITTLLVSFFFTVTFSQELAVQGIARDTNGTARVNEGITLVFELYYLNTITNNPISIYTDSKSLVTDSFGVFSTTIDLSIDIESLISNKETYLKITEGTVIISNEKLKSVPYATSALNGVPTGSIMPYLGVTAPQGWLLCDGMPISVNNSTEALRELLGGANTPNLQGMFLRGTGMNPVNNQSGPALKANQGEAFKSHNHNDTFSIANGGNHNHSYNDRDINDAGSGGDYANGDGTPGRDVSRNTGLNGIHNHTINGSISVNGGNETRPVNYGVNYIIKL